MHGATVFYWVLAALSGGFVLAGAAIAVHTATSRQRVVIRGDTLTLPASRWSKREVVIPLGEIERLRMVEMHRQRFIQLWHAGRKYAIAAVMLPDKRELDEIIALLAAHRPLEAA